ncbi:uncharacterized protein [Ptychodera flava]|uniref:uncharacterized protein n=1 Tax=Ptychodera flava TaxID=63121 RepID=UPI00396A0BF1
MNWKQSRYGQSGKRPLNHPKKRLFAPLPEKENADCLQARHKFANVIANTVPASCVNSVFKAMNIGDNDSEINNNDDNNDIKTTIVDAEWNDTMCNTDSASSMTCAPSMIDIAKPFKCDPGQCSEDHVKTFIASIPKLTNEQVHITEQSTIGQSENELWFYARKGRITASKFYNIFTKVNTLKDNASKRSKDVSTLIDAIMSDNAPDLPALKYGRNMECEAKQKYLQLRKHHKDLQTNNCGLFLDKDKPYIGASPDLLVYCSCCEYGLVECKCPYKIRHTEPSNVNLDYITFEPQSNTYKLKRNHSYYAQVQGQMAITQRPWCDFLVYTAHGYILERIYFDEKYWNGILQNLVYFFENYLAEALILESVKPL